jgi:hypothetical protein
MRGEELAQNEPQRGRKVSLGTWKALPALDINLSDTPLKSVLAHLRLQHAATLAIMAKWSRGCFFASRTGGPPVPYPASNIQAQNHHSSFPNQALSNLPIALHSTVHNIPADSPSTLSCELAQAVEVTRSRLWAAENVARPAAERRRQDENQNGDSRRTLTSST